MLAIAGKLLHVGYSLCRGFDGVDRGVEIANFGELALFSYFFDTHYLVC